MSFEALESVFKEPRFRRSLSRTDKKRIREFIVDPRNKRFSITEFERNIGVVQQAEEVLNALIDKCKQGKQSGADCDETYFFDKTTEYFCPCVSHDTIVLERKNENEGRCYICENSYILDESVSGEIVYINNAAPDTYTQAEDNSGHRSSTGNEIQTGHLHRIWTRLSKGAQWFLSKLINKIVDHIIKLIAGAIIGGALLMFRSVLPIRDESATSAPIAPSATVQHFTKTTPEISLPGQSKQVSTVQALESDGTDNDIITSPTP